jgi:hypothetical protein
MVAAGVLPAMPQIIEQFFAVAAVLRRRGRCADRATGPPRLRRRGPTGSPRRRRRPSGLCGVLRIRTFGGRCISRGEGSGFGVAVVPVWRRVSRGRVSILPGFLQRGYHRFSTIIRNWSIVLCLFLMLGGVLVRLSVYRRCRFSSWGAQRGGRSRRCCPCRERCGR